MPNVEFIKEENSETVSSKKFNAIFDNISEAVLLFSFQGQIIEVNNTACKLVNYSRETLLGMTLFDILSPEFASKMPESIKESVKSKGKKFESVFIRQDGQAVPVEMFLKIIELNNSNVFFFATAQDINDRKEMSKKLNSLESITLRNPNPILRVDKSSVLFCNYIAQRLFNTQQGKTLPDFLHQSVNNAMSTNSDIGLEIKLNNRFYFFNVIPEEGGNSANVYGIDITERRKAEKVINYLAKFPSENPNPILWVSKDSVLYANNAGEELFKVKKGSTIPKILDTFIKEVRTDKEFLEIEVEFDERIYLLNISKVKNQEYISIQGIDISERKKAEKVLKDYSLRMEFLNHIILAGNRANNIKSLLEEILISTIELMNFDGGGFYLVNDVNFTAELVCSHNLTAEFLDKTKVVNINKIPYRNIFIEGEPLFIGDYPLLNINQSQMSGFLSVASLPLFSKNKIIGSLNIGSINQHNFSTEEKEMLKFVGKEIGTLVIKMQTEEALRDARNITEFYRDLVVHDINNIFSNISTSLELISLFQRKKEEMEKIPELMDIIKEQIIRGSKLVSNIRNLSKISDSGIDLESIEAIQVLNDAIKFIQVSFPNININIQIESKFKKVFIQANEYLLDVFENILFNAVKYNDKPIIEIQIRISKNKEMGRNCLKIQFLDNGIGIPDNRKERILSNVSEGKKRVKGMGIGLYTVNKIIKNYKGKIWVEDRIKGDPTLGSNFIILIALGV
ncbi:MAG: Signal transduction histidine kinase [Candidatus Lokiarchaeum sp. GC14_75]|nr:MAG: Signal transduction histidine kinase [Candidatus Lokiarchaeum sp. GC14_75]